MWNFTRTRQTAGNICLVLFTAFLFTILVSPFTMVGSAEAASKSGITAVQKSNGQWVESGNEKLDPNADGSYTLLINLAVNPLTSDSFNDLRIDFEGAKGVISVYAKNSTQDAVYYDTYSKVYSLVYNVPADFKYTLNNIVYGKVYIGTESLFNIILTLNPPPPKNNTSPGGSPSTDTTTTTNTGKVTVTKDADGTKTATVAVDTAKITNLINNAQPVVIAVPENTAVAAVKVEMPSTILTTVAEKGKEITIKTNDVQFVIPPAALQVKELVDLITSDPDTKVAISVKEVTPASTGLADKLGVPENANLKAVGKVFSFEITAASSSGSAKISSFNGKLRVCIPYTDEDIAGIKEERLGAYRITSSGLVFLGGDVDKVKKELWFETESFSNYTIMAKIVAFADIMNHWAKNDIELMADKGIVKGVTNNKFAPNDSITRAQFATLLVKALGLTEVKPAVGTFKDVSSNAWYYSMVETAAANGLVTGYKGQFNPNGKITREEMAAMIANALKVEGNNVSLASNEVTNLLTKFSDKKQIAEWAQESVAVAVKEGIINGRTEKTFAPKDNATRAEGTVMLKRSLTSIDTP